MNDAPELRCSHCHAPACNYALWRRACETCGDGVFVLAPGWSGCPTCGGGGWELLRGANDETPCRRCGGWGAQRTAYAEAQR